MTRSLLDKNVVRYWTIALLKLANGRSLEPLQEKSLLLVQTKDNLFITQETYHILTKRVQLPDIVPLLLKRTGVLYPTKYFKRWVRRIQETTSLSREDAVMVAYGTFSTTSAASFLGIDTIITTDRGLYSEYLNRNEKLQERLGVLIATLDIPWKQARLPGIKLLK